MQIIPNLYLVNGFVYGQFQNSYVLKTEQGPLMIDCGQIGVDVFELIQKNCSRWGIELSGISHLFLTHAHFDHSSYAARLQRTGTKIIASQPAAQAMACGDDRCLGYAVSLTYEPCKVDRIVSDGEEITLGDLTIRCIAAPGHSNGSVVYEILQQGQRLWFVGDQVITTTGNDGAGVAVELGWKGSPEYDQPTYLETLRKLCHMDCDILLPGHGPPCIGNARRFMEAAYNQALTQSHQ